MSPEEVIAARFLEWLDTPGPYYDESNCPEWATPGDPMTDADDAQVTAAAILAALESAGYTVARLEKVGWSFPQDGPQRDLVALSDDPADDEGMERQWVPVYRISAPVEETPGER